METSTAELNIKSADGEVNAQNTGGMLISVLESLYSPSVYIINIASVNRTVWNKVAANINEMTATFRWGRVRGSGKTDWSDTRNIQIKKLQLRNSSGFLTAKLEATDMSFMLRQIPQRVFKEKTISEMVKQIATENGLDSDVKVSNNVKTSLIQAGMSDYEFLSDVLTARARCHVPILFYMKNGNVLVFKERNRASPTLTYAWQPKDKKTIPLNEVVSILTLDDSNFGTKGVTFDPLKRQTRPYSFEIDANDSSSLRESQFSGANAPSTLGSFPAVIDSIVVSNLEEAPDCTVKQRVSWNPSLGMQRVVLHSYMLPEAQIGTTVQLNTETEQGEKTFDTGVYLMYAVQHEINVGGAVYTNTFLERRGSE